MPAIDLDFYFYNPYHNDSKLKAAKDYKSTTDMSFTSPVAKPRLNLVNSNGRVVVITKRPVQDIGWKRLLRRFFNKSYKTMDSNDKVEYLTNRADNVQFGPRKPGSCSSIHQGKKPVVKGGK